MRGRVYLYTVLRWGGPILAVLYWFLALLGILGIVAFIYSLT
jgi:hypothetical protein